MDIEQTLRLACASPEPGVEFEETVMKRVSAAAWRATQPASHRSPRILLAGTLLMVAAAAAIFATWNSGSSTVPALSVQEVDHAVPAAAQLAAPEAARPGAPVSAPPEPATTPSSAPDTIHTFQSCNSPEMAPPAYTVLVRPLQFTTDDPAILSRVQAYYGALLDGLRRIPGLKLVDTEVAPAKPADFRLIVAANSDLDGNFISDREAGRVTVTLQTWTGTAFGKGVGTGRKLDSLAAGNCPLAPAQPNNCGVENAAAFDIGFALNGPLPRTPAQLACIRATQRDLQADLAQRRTVDPTIDMSVVRQLLQRIATAPQAASRNSSWSILRSSVRPELLQPLVAALRETTDEAFRKELVTLLAVKFAGDAAAQEALAAVVAGAPDTLLRHVAERALSGNGPWRDYAVARIRDASLPPAQRLEALYWMFDVTPLDPQQGADMVAAVLTTLRQGDGIPVLARLLVGTLQESGDAANELTGRWSQWVMGRLGPLNRPPVSYPAAAVDLLIACFDAMPTDLTLSNLAARRDDPRVAGKLESIAADTANPRLSERAARLLNQPLPLLPNLPPGL